MSRKTMANDAGSEEFQTIRAKAVNEVIRFLQMFIPVTTAKRIVSILLLIAGVPRDLVCELTGSCDRSVRQWKKQILSGETDKLLLIDNNAGRKSKFENIETQVLSEIAKGNYHTQQQIADMVKEKFGVEVSLMAVSRFLKKTASES